MSTPKYTTKQDVIAKGMIKKNDVFYKRTLLEIWYDKGWLELKHSPYGEDDRLRFGLKFMTDYQLVCKLQMPVVYFNNDKVDISSSNLDDNVYDIIDRYRHAVRSIPKEFWPMVKQICLQEQEPVLPKDISDRQKAYINFLYRVDLCRGLDRIIDAYTKKLKQI